MASYLFTIKNCEAGHRGDFRVLDRSDVKAESSCFSGSFGCLNLVEIWVDEENLPARLVLMFKFCGEGGDVVVEVSLGNWRHWNLCLSEGENVVEDLD